jgi:hypothetical protein
MMRLSWPHWGLEPRWQRANRSITQLPRAWTKQFTGAILHFYPGTGIDRMLLPALMNPHLRRALLWIACVLYETSGLLSPFHDAVESLLNIDLRSVFKTKDYHIDKKFKNVRGERRDRLPDMPLDKNELTVMAAGLPAWFVPWCLDRKSLVLNSPEHDQ